jgi:hypothetical protein
MSADALAGLSRGRAPPPPLLACTIDPAVAAFELERELRGYITDVRVHECACMKESYGSGVRAAEFNCGCLNRSWLSLSLSCSLSLSLPLPPSLSLSLYIYIYIYLSIYLSIYLCSRSVAQSRAEAGLGSAWDSNLAHIVQQALHAYELQRCTGVVAGNEVTEISCVSE